MQNNSPALLVFISCMMKPFLSLSCEQQPPRAGSVQIKQTIIFWPAFVIYIIRAKFILANTKEASETTPSVSLELSLKSSINFHLFS